MTSTLQSLTFHLSRALRRELIEGSEPGVADNAVSILRSTITEQIGIDVEEHQAADDISI